MVKIDIKDLLNNSHALKTHNITLACMCGAGKQKLAMCIVLQEKRAKLFNLH